MDDSTMGVWRGCVVLCAHNVWTFTPTCTHRVSRGRWEHGKVCNMGGIHATEDARAHMV